MDVFLVVMVTSAIFSGLTAQEPCDPTVHVEIDNPKRSTGYETAAPESPLCDIGLKHGWYRFTSLAGGELATTCPKKYQCGTHVPLWMKGSHPTVADGVVDRQVCGDYVGSAPLGDPCCDEIIDISVKNCGQFYVYRLSSTPACPVSYCAGTAVVCPAGKWSPTQFPPCRDQYPGITARPTVKGPNINGNGFNFQCEIDFEEQDPEQVFEVTWLFDGEEDNNIVPQSLMDPSRVATLDGSKLAGHLPSNLQCEVRAYYRGNKERASDPLLSNVYFMGIQVIPARLELSETELFKQVTVSSTVPILCQDNLAQCCLTLNLDTDAKNPQITMAHTCNYKICQSDWNTTEKLASVEVSVAAYQDLTTDGNQQLLMTFNPLTPTAGGPYLDIFFRHRPQQLQVTVKDQVSYTCSMTGDPHIASFDSKTFHLFLVGDFIAYDVPQDHFQVQIRTWPCGAVSCICGVVVREKNDIIRISMCDQAYNGPHTAPIVDIMGKLRDGTIVQRSQDGLHVGVYLPSGAEIRVDSTRNYMNVFVTGPGTHHNKARGICGTNDGIKDNELTHRDGRVDPICNNCQPKNFFRSWRVGAEESLFMTVPDKVDDDQDVEYCTCNNPDRVVTCDFRANRAGTGTACPKCETITKIPIAKVPDRRPVREVIYEDVDEPDTDYQPADLPEVDPNKEWPNGAGVTEAQASTMCQQALERSQLHSMCSKMEMAESYVMDCMSDILFSDSTDFLEAITTAFTADCQISLAQDPTSYETDQDGRPVMKAEYMENLCDLACEEHGECGEKGTCLCEAGWEGVNCQIQSGIGPQLLNIRSGQLCDVAQRPCQKIYLDVTNTELSDSLVCRMQTVDANGADLGDPVTTEAEIMSAHRISCLRNYTVTSSQHYRISASNDGHLFGNALALHVFDSTCLDCSVKGCSVKETACHIDGACYPDGATHTDDVNKLCDVSKTRTAWTVRAGKNPGTTILPQMWMLLLPLTGVL